MTEAIVAIVPILIMLTVYRDSGVNTCCICLNQLCCVSKK